jgi:hypothetical protein
MLGLLLFMYHIALRTQCIPLFNCGHLLHIRLDHAGLESRIQGNKSMSVGSLQAPSYEDTNIIVIKASPSASHHNH